jgi:hypothetical protein
MWVRASWVDNMSLVLTQVHMHPCKAKKKLWGIFLDNIFYTFSAFSRSIIHILLVKKSRYMCINKVFCLLSPSDCPVRPSRTYQLQPCSTSRLICLNTVVHYLTPFGTWSFTTCFNTSPVPLHNSGTHFSQTVIASTAFIWTRLTFSCV